MKNPQFNMSPPLLSTPVRHQVQEIISNVDLVEREKKFHF